MADNAVEMGTSDLPGQMVLAVLGTIQKLPQVVKKCLSCFFRVIHRVVVNILQVVPPFG